MRALFALAAIIAACGAPASLPVAAAPSVVAAAAEQAEPASTAELTLEARGLI